MHVDTRIADVEVCFNHIEVAQTTSSPEQFLEARGEARKGYDEVLAKRPRFKFADHKALALDIRLAQLKARLKLLGMNQAISYYAP